MQELRFHPREAIGIGTCRFVFQHPRHPDRVVKVVTPRFADRMRRRHRRYGMSGQFAGNKVAMKELAYFLHLEARRPDLLSLFPWMHGLVPTSLGLGLVCEKIESENGALAPTLRELAETGRLTRRHRALARNLCDTLARDHIVFNDMHAGNIAAQGPLDRPRRLVIIDGFGDPAVPPVRRLWPWYNRLAQRARLGALRDELGLAQPVGYSTWPIRPSVYGS